MNGKKYTPLLSIITPTLDNESTMHTFMESLARQTYPHNRIEHVVLDGGSKDSTAKIAQKYGAQVIHNKKVLAESGVNLGMQKARGDLCMILAVDNIYLDEQAIEKIVGIFEDATIFAAFPKHNSTSDDSLFSKYHNTFTDPFNHFVYGDSANGRTFNRIYSTIESNNIYDVYDYNSNPMPPMIAFAQGFTIRKQYRRSKADEFDDILPIIKLIKGGKKIAFVHSVSLIHHTTKDIAHFIRKNRWATRNALSKKNYGISYRETYLTKMQRFRIKLWPFYALSIVFPSLVALYGFLKDRQTIWLFHPIMCFLSATSSIWEVLVYNTGKQAVTRQ